MFLGHTPQAAYTAVEQAMDGLLRVAAQATLARAQGSGLFSDYTLVTNDLLFEPTVGVTIIKTDPRYNAEFHAGAVLRQIVQEFEPNNAVVYIGGGAGLLLGDPEWQALATALDNSSAVVTANNYFSSDFVGWRPANALLRLSTAQLPVNDNNLAYALCRQAGLKWQQLLPGNGRTLQTLFDIDTPTDAALLKAWVSQPTVTLSDSEESQILRYAQNANHLGLRQYLADVTEFDNIPVQAVLQTLSNYEGEVVVCGRISGGVHRLLETASHGQTRVFSEERGMRASQRDVQGKVVSLAGFLLDELGAEGFFKRMARMGQAAIIDSRVIFAHQGLQPSRADRFNSDALNPAVVIDPKIRAFTLAAREAKERWGLSVMLGGHSAVAGGLMLLLSMVPPRPYE